MTRRPGILAILGSGETASTGRRVYERLFEKRAVPVHFAVLETPAGFQLNSQYVAEHVAQFIENRLRNFHPKTDVIPARRKEDGSGTNDPQLAARLLKAGYIFMGPGSPTYAVKHLADTHVWHSVVATHRLGSTLFIASAAAVALSEFAVPVYEVYKVGEDLHWSPGLNLLGPYGLRLAVVAHWNNYEGGEHHDTSRCYMGKPRMERLMTMLPPEVHVLGVDEHTALVIDFEEETCSVSGRGVVTLVRGGQEAVFASGGDFALSELGPVRWPEPQEGIPRDIWKQAVAAQEEDRAGEELSGEIATIIEARERARAEKDWKTADSLRDEAAGAGYLIQDTPEGPRWERISRS